MIGSITREPANIQRLDPMDIPSGLGRELSRLHKIILSDCDNALKEWAMEKIDEIYKYSRPSFIIDDPRKSK